MPNFISYNAILLAYSNNEITDVEKNEFDLKQNDREGGRTKFVDLYYFYQDTFSNTKIGYVQKAEDLLRALERKYENGQVNLKPDLV